MVAATKTMTQQAVPEARPDRTAPRYVAARGSASAGIWRHRACLPVYPEITLGEGSTPLLALDRVAAQAGGGYVMGKLECLNPTGSFKDRGSAVMLNHLIEVCRDGERGFAIAARTVKSRELKHLFYKLAEQRREFAGELLPHALELEGTAPAEGRSLAALHRAWIRVRARLAGDPDSPLRRRWRIRSAPFPLNRRNPRFPETHRRADGNFWCCIPQRSFRQSPWAFPRTLRLTPPKMREFPHERKRSDRNDSNCLARDGGPG